MTAPKAKPAVLSEDELAYLVRVAPHLNVSEETRGWIVRLLDEHAQLKREVELQRRYHDLLDDYTEAQDRFRATADERIRRLCTNLRERLGVARDELAAFDAAKPGAGEG